MRTESLVAAIGGLLTIVLITALLVYNRISELSFVTPLCATALVCLVIHGFSRLRVLDLKNLKLTLDHIEQVRDDIYAREQDLKNASLALSELILFKDVVGNRLGDDRFHKNSEKWTIKKAQELKVALLASDAERNHVFRYAQEFGELDRLRDADEGTDELWERIVDTIQAECEGLG